MTDAAKEIQDLRSEIKALEQQLVRVRIRQERLEESSKGKHKDKKEKNLSIADIVRATQHSLRDFNIGDEVVAKTGEYRYEPNEKSAVFATPGVVKKKTITGRITVYYTEQRKSKTLLPKNLLLVRDLEEHPDFLRDDVYYDYPKPGAGDDDSYHTD